jgi:hypothetical protein
MPNETLRAGAKLVAITVVVTVLAVVVVQVAARMITGKSLNGPGVAIGVPVAFTIILLMRGRLGRKPR